MEITNFMDNECYYKNYPDNNYSKHSTYGLNLEGIKKYYLTPDNNFYNHQEKLKKETLKRIYDNEQQKINKLSLNINSTKNSKDTIEEIGSNKEDRAKSLNKTKLNTLNNQRYKKFNFLNSYSIKTNKIKDLNEKREKNTIYSTINPNKTRIDRGNFQKASINCFRKSQINKQQFLPKINPRPIILDYCLTYSNNNGSSYNGKYTNGYKNLGYNGYNMGENYNPDNYEVRRKNRTKRNVFGTLFPH